MSPPDRHPRPRPRPRARRRRLLVATGLVLAAVIAGTVWVRGGDDGDDGWLTRLARGAGIGDDGGSGSAGAGRGGAGRGGGEDSDGAADGGDDVGPGPTGTLEIVTAADLEPFLLRGEDLPIGWLVTEPRPRSGGDDCLSAEGLAPTEARAAARISFRRGANGPVLTNAVIDHFRQDAAAAAFEAARQALEACTGRPEAAGQAVLRTTSMTSSADEAVAVSIRIDAGGDSATGRLLYARVGRYVTYLVVLGLDSDEIRVADPALELVVERLRSG